MIRIVIDIEEDSESQVQVTMRSNPDCVQDHSAPVVGMAYQLMALLQAFFIKEGCR